MDRWAGGSNNLLVQPPKDKADSYIDHRDLVGANEQYVVNNREQHKQAARNVPKYEQQQQQQQQGNNIQAGIHSDAGNLQQKKVNSYDHPVMNQAQNYDQELGNKEGAHQEAPLYNKDRNVGQRRSDIPVKEANAQGRREFNNMQVRDFYVDAGSNNNQAMENRPHGLQENPRDEKRHQASDDVLQYNQDTIVHTHNKGIHRYRRDENSKPEGMRGTDKQFKKEDGQVKADPRVVRGGLDMQDTDVEQDEQVKQGYTVLPTIDSK